MCPSARELLRAGQRVYSRWTSSFLLALTMAGAPGCDPLGEPSPSDIRGLVVLPTSPLAEADLIVWQLGTDGERLEQKPILRARTDERGRFDIDIDIGSGHYGALRLEVHGGHSREYWSPEFLSFDDPSQPARRTNWGSDNANPPLLSAIFNRVQHRPDGYTLVISPWTTLAEARAWGWFAGYDGTVESTMGRVSARSLALLAEHLGLASIIETQPVTLDQQIDTLSPAVHHALSLAALSTLARQIAEQSGSSVQAVNTVTLIRALTEDALGSEAIFDGLGPDSNPLGVGTCGVPADCPAEFPAPECNPSCRLGPNSLRAHLARALLEYAHSGYNKTDLDLTDILDVAVAIAGNDEPELFGQALPEPDSEPPVIAFSPASSLSTSLSTVYDEQNDHIDFDQHTAAPIHTSLGRQRDLSEPGVCHTVHKHVTRLHSDDDNPLRWTLSVTDPGLGFLLPDATEYRVRIPAQSRFLTDWLPAKLLTRDADGVHHYEVILLRDQVPELATEAAVFEIAFRAIDLLQNRSAEVTRCWTHIPLAAPVQVIGPAVQSSGSGSLRAATLSPDNNNLAPSINGTESRAVMEFEVRNGTAFDTYVTFQYSQPGAAYSKQWLLDNLQLHVDAQSDPDCLAEQRCYTTRPDEYWNDLGYTAANIPNSVWSVRVWDITTASRMELLPCDDGCDADEYRLLSRLGPDRPRRYQVALTLRNMGFLFPDRDPPAVLQYVDQPLDPFYHSTTHITGTLGETWLYCNDEQPGGICKTTALYRPTRWLESATILSSIPLRVIGRVAATSRLEPRQPQSNGTFRDPVLLADELRWEAREESLPPTLPRPSTAP